MPDPRLFDLDDEVSQPPDGLELVKGWLDQDVAAESLEAVDGLVWSSALSRRVQHYGARYDYSGRRPTQLGTASPPSPRLRALAMRIVADGVMPTQASQIIVNEYEPGQGITAHVDSADFGPVVVSLSLGDEWPMMFRSSDGRTYELWLPIGSLLVLAGPARSVWTHEIAARKTDRLDGRRRARKRRASITFRTIPQDDSKS